MHHSTTSYDRSIYDEAATFTDEIDTYTLDKVNCCHMRHIFRLGFMLRSLSKFNVHKCL